MALFTIPGGGEKTLPQEPQAGMQGNLFYAPSDKEKLDYRNQMDFDSNSSTMKIPFTDSQFSVNEDREVTLANVLTPEERQAKVIRYMNYFKEKNPEGAQTFDTSKLFSVGFNQEEVDGIVQELRTSAWIPGEGLQTDIETPMSPATHLTNALVKPFIGWAGDFGAFIQRGFQTRGLPNEIIKEVEAGGIDALSRYQKEVDIIKNLGFGDEMLKGGKVSNNIFEQQKYADTVLHPAVANLKSSLKKEMPYHPGISTELKTVVSTMEDVHNKERNAIYGDMKANASNNLYSIKDLRAQIHDKLTASDVAIPEEAYNKVKKIIDYKKRVQPKEQVRELKSLDTRISQIKEKLKNANPQQKGYLTNQLNALKKKSTSLSEELGDEDYIGEMDFVNMIQRINANTRGSHMGLSLSDTKVVEGLRASKKLVDNYFEDIVKNHNPKVYDLFKDAQKKAREGYIKFGAPGNRTPLGKILDGEDSDKVLGSIMESPYEVKTIAEELNRLSPGTGNKFAETWLRRTVGPIKSGKDEVFKGRGIDYTSINSKLDNVLSNPEAVDTIESLFGSDKVAQLNATKSVIGSLDSMVKSMGYNGPLDAGVGNYLKSNGVLGVPGNLARVVLDKTRQQVGALYESTVPDVIKTTKLLQKIPVVGEYVPDTVKNLSGRYDKETQALDRIAEYAKNYTSGKSGFRQGIENKGGGPIVSVLNESGVLEEEDLELINNLSTAGLAPKLIYDIFEGTLPMEMLKKAISVKSRQVIGE